MLSSKRLLLLSVLLAAFAFPGCGKKDSGKKGPKSKIERSEKRHKKHSRKHSKKRSKKRSKKERSKKADKSKKGLLSKSY